MRIFENLTAPNSGMFYQRNDPDDIRLGEVVRTNPTDYEQASVVLLGCPQDEGVHRNKGRIGAAQAPDAIRQALYKLVPPQNEIILFDAGNTRIEGTLEDIHARHREIVEQLLRDGKQVISLGGGNDLSYADCSAVATVFPNTLVINVDAHFDVRANDKRNSGTPYRQLLEEGFINPKRFYEVGNMAEVNSPVFRDYLLTQGAHIIDLNQLRANGIEATFSEILAREAEAVFIGLDMDVVHVSDAPGVSAPNSLGISAYDFSAIASLVARDSRCKMLEITEVNPTYDIDTRTSRLAAMAIHQFLSHTHI